jgi:hypothetical protein
VEKQTPTGVDPDHLTPRMADQPRDPDVESQSVTEVPAVVSSAPQHRRPQLGPAHATLTATSSEEHEDEMDPVPELSGRLRWRDVSEKHAQEGQLSTIPLSIMSKLNAVSGAEGRT